MADWGAVPRVGVLAPDSHPSTDVEAVGGLAPATCRLCSGSDQGLRCCWEVWWLEGEVAEWWPLPGGGGGPGGPSMGLGPAPAARLEWWKFHAKVSKMSPSMSMSRMDIKDLGRRGEAAAAGQGGGKEFKGEQGARRSGDQD